MEISKRYDAVRQSRAVRTIDAVVLWGPRSMVRRLLGAPLTEAELRKREAEKHMYKAELGALAVREAISSGDDQLRLYGEAMIAKAADAIATHPDQALAQTMARGMAGPLSIRLTAGNPYVHPAIVDRATAIPRDSSEQPAND